MTKYIIITGGCGFVGSHLLKYIVDLKLEDTKIVVIDDLSNGSPQPKYENVEYVIGPTQGIFQNAQLAPWYPRREFIWGVFHLGEFSRVNISLHPKYSYKTFESNIVGTQEILKFWMKTSEMQGINYGKLPRLVYAGSSTRFVEENYNKSPYAFTKYMNAELIKNIGRWYAYDYKICYFYNVYGENSKGKLPGDHQSVIDIWMRKRIAPGHQQLPIHGDGTQTRDFTYVGDIVDGLWKAFLVDNEPYPFPESNEYHLGTGVEYSLLDVAKMILKGENKPETRMYFTIDMAGDRKSSLAPNAETMKILDWKPKVKLPDYIDQWLKDEDLYK